MISIKDLKDPSTDGELLIDFGIQPVSNRFPDPETREVIPGFPLQLRVNKNSGLLHLGQLFPVQELKPRYDWLTCFEPEDHLDNMVQNIIALKGVNGDSFFGAYSFKDDTTLHRLEKLGYKNTMRLDPVQDLGVSDPCANVETYQLHFTAEKAKTIAERYGKVDVFIIRHVVEHAYDLHEFIKATRELVKPDGYIIWELPDCQAALEQGDCTTLWEEHTYYFTSSTFCQLMAAYDMPVIYFESVPYALENSLVVMVSNNKDANGLSLVNDPQAEVQRALNFAKQVSNRKQKIRSILEGLKSRGERISIFGAGHLSVAFLSLMEIADLVDFVLDDNPNKKGKLMPVASLPILGSQELYNNKTSICLLGLNPQNQPKVIAKHQAFLDSGGRFLSVFPGSENSLDQFQND